MRRPALFATALLLLLAGPSTSGAGAGFLAVPRPTSADQPYRPGRSALQDPD